MQKKSTDVAVVGVGCWYPGAKTPKELWENILARRREFRRFPDVRLPLAHYYDADKSTPDKTYGTRGAFIDGFQFDLQKRRVPRSSYDSTDIAHWLALEVALQAVEDSGYKVGTIPADRAGVIVGNTLTGEQTRSSAMRLRWPFVQRSLEAAAQQTGLSSEWVSQLSQSMESHYKSVFAPITEDSLAGGLSNTIAGRISNFLNIHGGGYTVDGACSSSLIAVATAARSIASGELDIALAGGVDVSLDTFELIGFAKTGALTATEMSVYDKKGNGFLPGEGSGFVVLKNLEQARRDGDYVYAVIKGWGISSDGKGGITAPKAEGQASALKRAYQMAGYQPTSLNFVEGHGTGTTVGDRVELEGVVLALTSGDTQPGPRSCGMTSFKSIVGHTKAAAGIGGFIKAVLAVNQRVVPPTAGCTELNPVFETKATSLYPVLRGEVCPEDSTLRAGVSAMGFGGINCHVTLESGDPARETLRPRLDARSVLASHQVSEVFVFGAESQQLLLKSIEECKARVSGMSHSELPDLSQELSQNPSLARAPFRAAVVVKSVAELEAALETHKGIVFGAPSKAPRITYLYPGQGSQMLNMGRRLVERHTWAREMTMIADRVLSENGFAPISPKINRSIDTVENSDQLALWNRELADTTQAQPAICLASALWTEQLSRLGIYPSAVAGHSLGELTAFYAAKAMDFKSLIRLAAERGRAMAANSDKPGAMASLACSDAQAEALMQGQEGYVVIANRNSANQTVISGEVAAVEAVLARAMAAGITGKRLNVSNAFHSDLVLGAASVLKGVTFLPETLRPNGAVRVFTGMDGTVVKPGTVLREHFGNQVLSSVEFVKLVSNLKNECDMMIEVGPGRVLSGLVATSCLPVESRAEWDFDLNRVLAELYVAGQEIRWEALFQDRLVRPFKPAFEKLFIENPCERPFGMFGDITSEQTQGVSPVFKPIEIKNKVTAPLVPAAVSASVAGENNSVLVDTIVQRTGFERSSITPELRLLDDLNLDSIKAAELISQVAKALGISGKVDPVPLANATVAEIEKVFAGVAGAGASPVVQAAESRATWVRNFVMDRVEKRLPENLTPAPVSEGHLVCVFDGKSDSLHASIDRMLSGLSRAAVDSLVENPDRKPRSLTLVGCGFGTPVSAFAASLHLERPELKVRAVQFESAELSPHMLTLVHAERSTEGNFESVYYDKSLVRSVLRPRVIEAVDLKPRGIAWSQEDVVLVTGGAKGITAACALALAEKNGLKMALIGSSSFSEQNPDAEIQATLLKYRALGLSAQYYACDITNAQVLRDTVQRIESEMGRVTGVIHGAGANKPRKAETVSAQAAFEEIKPKVLGAENLMQIFEAKGLKLFCGLTSIIGVTGMAGNAWYGFSNELTDQMLGKFQETNRGTAVVTLAYSVWDEVGMGARMGSVHHLARLGIDAIPALDGIRHFVGLCEQNPESRQVVIAARLGGLDTWQSEKPVLQPHLRFQDQVKAFEAGVEVVVETTLHPDRDPYLLDHLYKGSLLFPTVFGLEAMAQVTSLVAREWDFKTSGCSIENIKLERPIVADPQTGVKIRIEAFVFERETSSAPKKVRVQIRTESTNFSYAHFEATFVLEQTMSIQSPPSDWPKAPALALHPKRDLYGPILFQGESFQRIQKVAGLEKTGENQGVCFFETVCEANPSAFLLGDPYSRDSLLQSVQVIIPQEQCLPISIRKIECGVQSVSKYGTRKVQTVLEGRDEKDYTASIYVLGDEGQVIEKLTGYQLRILDAKLENPSLADLVNPEARENQRLTDKIRSLSASLQVRVPEVKLQFLPVGFENLSKEARHKVETGFLGFPLTWTKEGKPEQGLSLSHDGEWCVYTLGRDAQGCDLTALSVRTEEDWKGLLGEERSRMLPKLCMIGDRLDEAGARLWAATEAVVKATGTAAPISLDESKSNPAEKALLFSVSGSDFSVLTFPFDPAVGGKKMFALIVYPNSKHSKPVSTKSVDSFGFSSDPKIFWIEKDPSQKFSATYYRFPLLMEDTANLSRTVYFSRFNSWMGKMREMSLMPILPELSRMTETGKWGIVTNSCETTVYGEASGQDKILARFRIVECPPEIRDSTTDLTCDWSVERGDGSLELIARTTMRTTWVAILGHGLVRREPLPAFFKDFVDKIGCEPLSAQTTPVWSPSFSRLKLGERVQSQAAVSEWKTIVSREKFQTDLEDSNLVGNIYFSNYTRWQGRTRDRFFQKLAPELFQGTGLTGEWVCLRSHVEHLREAMPFDQIEVTLYIKSVYENGVKMYFEYHRVDPTTGERTKLAYSEQDAVWVVRDADRAPVASLLPSAFRAQLGSS